MSNCLVPDVCVHYAMGLCVIFDCELYRYRDRCWLSCHEQEDGSGGWPPPDSHFRLDLQLGYSSMKSNGAQKSVLAQDLAHTILSGKCL